MSARKVAPNAGRPALPDGEGKREVLILRLSAEEKRAIESAAKRAGESVSAWVRGIVASAATDPTKQDALKY